MEHGREDDKEYTHVDNGNDRDHHGIGEGFERTAFELENLVAQNNVIMKEDGGRHRERTDPNQRVIAKKWKRKVENAGKTTCKAEANGEDNVTSGIHVLVFSGSKYLAEGTTDEASNHNSANADISIVKGAVFKDKLVTKAVDYHVGIKITWHRDDKGADNSGQNESQDKEWFTNLIVVTKVAY